jgi:hypothetical protein
MTSAMPNATSGTNPLTAEPAVAGDTRQMMLEEIGAKWGKLSVQDLSTLKTKDDLVDQVAAKYSIERVHAQREVDALMKDRLI